MGRVLPVLAHALRHPVVALGAVLLLAAVALDPFRSITTGSTDSYYEAALATVALSSWCMARYEPALWARPTWELDLLRVSSAVLLALGACALAIGLRWWIGDRALPALPVVGCCHLASLAQVTSRLPTSAGARALAFVLAATAIPALLPALRPWLDASPSFQPGYFPRSFAAVAPILTLAVLSVALRSSRRSEVAGEGVA